MAIQTKPIACPYCDGRSIVRKGTHQGTYRLIQVYRCKDCLRYFSSLSGVHSKYPLHFIPAALELYYAGFSEKQVAERLRQRFRKRVPRRTISLWLKRYRPLCTFTRLRQKALALFTEGTMVVSTNLDHRQVYAFKFHRAKQVLARNDVPPPVADRVAKYLETVSRPDYPHEFFQPKENEEEALRSSKIAFPVGDVVHRHKENLANDLAALGLLAARTTRDRHPSVQDFMLTVDSTTIACEVPVYLTPEEIAYFKAAGFSLDVPQYSSPITGHIDVLQFRNGLVHILDYKPDARKITPVNQLLVYALALASRTRLAVKNFKCAWFDDKDYFEFFPLETLYKKRPVVSRAA